MTDQRVAETSLAQARTVAAYLTALRSLVNEASASRQDWIRKLGTIMREARSSEVPEGLAVEAGRVGVEQLGTFRAFRGKLDQLEPPAICQSCHLVVAGWLDKQMAACDVMIEVGNTGDLNGLRATQGLLAEGRGDTRRFSAEYAELVDWLRKRLAAHRTAPKRPRWSLRRHRLWG